MNELDAGGQESGTSESTGENFEQEASAEGWKPKEQWGGNPDEWVDAETFVKRGREINPILRRNNERLQREISAVRRELQEAGASIKNLQEYNAKLEEKAYERAMKTLRAEKKAALAAGDHEQAAELEEELDELREKKPAVQAQAPQATPKVDPILTAWMEENSSWFNDQNPEMVDYANAVGIRLRRNDPQAVRYQGQAFLDTIKEEVKKMFPDKFGRSKGPNIVEGGGMPANGSAGGGKGKKIADLPREDQVAFRDLAGQKWYVDLAKSKNLTPEQMYLQDYGD